MDIVKKNIANDNWLDLKAFTKARIALGRAGVSIPLKEILQFRLAHAHARDAVYSLLDLPQLHAQISEMELDCINVQSRVVNRDEYLKRPDLGRQLSEDSIQYLKDLHSVPTDIAIIISDGLSATAVNENSISVLRKMRQINSQLNYSWAPIVFVQQGRVAIADEIAQLLKSRLVVHLIGERPGLSSYNSLGAYITYNPQKGLTDESRNCISNIRAEGLPLMVAAEKIMYMIREIFKLNLSGIQLKDTFPGHLLLD